MEDVPFDIALLFLQIIHNLNKVFAGLVLTLKKKKRKKKKSLSSTVTSFCLQVSILPSQVLIFFFLSV